MTAERASRATAGAHARANRSPLRWCLPLWLATAMPTGCQGTSDEPTLCPAGSGQDAALRRLTTRQYFNALRDLFVNEDGETLEVLPDPQAVEIEDPEALAERVWLPSELKVRGYAGIGTGQVVSPFLIERYNDNAIKIGREVSERAEEFVTCGFEEDPANCGAEYLLGLARLAWRRPLTDAEREDLSATFVADLGTHGASVALQLGLHRVLQSPHFLYVPEFGRPTGALDECPESQRQALSDHELATRLSLFLWNSIPDTELLARADAGELHTRAQVVEAASEMLRDPRYLRGLWGFHDEWLEVESFAGSTREPIGAGYFLDEYHPPLFLQQIRLMVERAGAGEGGTLRQLLTTSKFPMHGALMELYGVEVDGLVPPGDPDSEDFELDEVWIDVDLPSHERAGVFTSAGIMQSLASTFSPSPVRRGVFVLDRLVCNEPPPPPASVDTAIPENQSDDATPITNRQKFAAHTDQSACRACHEGIDGFGFAFENYNSAGGFWTEEPWAVGIDWEERPDLITWLSIDASGTLSGPFVPDDLQGTSYANAPELLRQMAEQRSVHRCYTEHLYQYALGRALPYLPSDRGDYDDQTIDALADDFFAADGMLETLVLDLVGSEAFRTKVGDEP